MKKIFVLTIAFVMLVSNFSCVFATEDDRALSEKVSAVDLLEKLEILYPKDDNAYKNYVTREDYAVYLARLIKENEYATETERYFVDLPAESYAFTSVNSLVKRGVLSVGADKMFRPDEKITGIEAAKTLLVLLGYGDLCEAKGGYPTGYLKVANTIDIMEGIEPYKEMTLNDVATIFETALTLPIYDIVSISGDGEKIYKENSDTTLLSVYYNMYKSEGVITAVGEVSIIPGIKVAPNEVYIDGVVYSADSVSDAYETIGQNAEFIYEKKNQNDVGKIIYIHLPYSKNLWEISIDDVESIDESRISYSEGNRSKTKNLENITILYNGAIPKTGVSDILQNLKKGTIKLSDYNGDGKYDLMIINDYRDFTVRAIEGNGVRFYNDLQDNDYIVPDDYDYLRVIDKDGNAIELSQIKLYNVLSLADSSDGKILEVMVNDTVVSGNVEKIRGTEDTYITVDGSEYKIDKDLYNAKKDVITAGGEYEFRLNAFDEIAWVKPLSGVWKSAYLIASAVTDKSFEPTLKLKVFNENGELKELNLDSKIKMDNISCRNTEYRKILDIIPETSGETVATQLIRYKDNKDGLGTEIDTYGGDGFLKRTTNGVESLTNYWSRFGKTILYSSNTLVYRVPRDEDVMTANAENFSVGAPAGFYRTLSYPVEAYKFDIDNEFEDVIICRLSDTYTQSYDYANSNMIMVSEVAERLGDDGDVVGGIKGLTGGREVEYIMSDNTTDASTDIASIGEGDLIRCLQDRNGKVIEIDLLYDADREECVGWDQNDRRGIYFSSSFTDNFQLSFGYVKEKGRSVVKWSLTPGGDTFEAYNVSSLPIMIYDRNKRSERVYKGTIDDMTSHQSAAENCDKIIIQFREANGVSVAIYK